MDLTSIFITGIIFLSCYKIIELFVHKKERLALIEKLTPDNGHLFSHRNITNILGNERLGYFTTLRWGCLAVGLGLGMLIYSIIYISLLSTCKIDLHWQLTTTLSSSLALLGGGAGLLTAFVIEKSSRKKGSLLSGEA